MVKKRGHIFTTDALIALSVIILILIIASGILFYKSGSMINREYFSEDLITVLSDMNINQTNNEYINNMIANGTITNLENSVLEQIGEFWAEGKENLSTAIFLNISDRLIPENQGYGLWIDEDLIYSNNKTIDKTLMTSKSLISGISKNRTRIGYNARAFAHKTRKNNTLIVKGDIISSSVKSPSGGNNQNKVIVEYEVNLPLDAVIHDAYWFIEAAWTDNKFKAYINEVHIPGSDASGSKMLTDLESYISPGENTAKVEFRYGSGGLEGGDDGASHFVVEYSTEQMNTLQELEKKHLAGVNSSCSIRYKKPVFALNKIKSINIYLNAAGTNATLKYVIDGAEYNISKKNITGNTAEWNDYEIKSAMDSEGINYTDLIGKYFFFVIDIDEYNPQESPDVQRKIFDNSYVDVDVELTKEVYGHIDLTRVVPICSYSDDEQGDFYRNLEWRYNLSTNDTDLMALDSQFAWLYQSGSDPSQEIISNNQTLYKHPPSPLIIELARYGFTQNTGNIKNGENIYNLHFSAGYGVNPFNSMVDYTILLKGMVPYGSTFPTHEEAVNDAIQRLEEILGVFIQATEIENETISISQVPSMWGPAVAEVRTWH